MRAVAPLDDRALPNSLWRYLLDRNRMVLGGALSEGGNLLAWLARTCQIGDLAAAEVAAAQLPPAAQGLDVLPFIAGERSLGWHDDARMIISGITSETTPTDLVRAMLEALAYRLGALHAALARALPESAGAQMIGSGGTLLRSALLQGIVADVLGAPLALTSAGEASARGAALLALRALGALPADALPPTDIARTVASDPTHAAIYRRAAERQQALYDALLGAKGQ
jgi:gluconokinase